MDQSSNVSPMGWTRRSAAVSVLLVMEEHRKHAGERAAKIREDRGHTQEALAHMSGVTVKTISRFENGRNEGRLDTVNRIAKALGVSREEIIGAPPAPLGLGETTQMDRIEEKLDRLLAALDAQAPKDSVDAEVQDAADRQRQRSGSTAQDKRAQ